MTSQPPQHELFVSERPVRSDLGQERIYARRRLATVIMLAVVLGGGGYAIWGGGPSDPTEIPTIKAEGDYKQKPADPGGIDIPHQDVRVYDQLESKNGDAPQVEHLLPPPEVPQEVSRPAEPASAPVPASGVSPTTDASPVFTPVAAPTTPSAVPAVSSVAVPAEPVAAPAVAEVAAPPKAADILPSAPAKAINTTVAPVSAPPPPVVTPKPKAAVVEPKAPAPAQTLSIDQVIKNVGKKTPAPPTSLSSAAMPTAAKKEAPKVLSATGRGAIQVASLPGEAQARAMMEKLQQKYAAELGSAKLRIVRADLGSRGIYYRIQSQNLSENEANHICSSLKRVNAGCIFVGK